MFFRRYSFSFLSSDASGFGTKAKSIIKATPKTINLWANLLAIFAAITLTGVIDISVNPNVEILYPTYVVKRHDLDRKLSEFNYPLKDSLLKVVFDSRTIIFVDIPHANAILTRSGEVVYGILESPNGNKFEYKEFTNGNKVFRSVEAIYDTDRELKNESGLSTEDELSFTPQEKLSSKDKKTQTMPFFADLIINTYSDQWKYISNDSLMKIDEEFRSYNRDSPPLLTSALFHTRRVYSLLSIENYSDYDVNALKINIFKKFNLASDDYMILEAWSIGKSILEVNEMYGNKIEITIPNLVAKSDVVLIVSTWFSQLKKEDIKYNYQKFISLDKKLVMLILISTLIFSIFCRYIVEVQNNKNHSREQN